MDASKIAGFYDDPVKRACDEASLAKAFDLRAFSVDPSWRWQTKRRIKFLGQYAVGALRRRHRKFIAPSHDRQGIPAVTRT